MNSENTNVAKEVLECESVDEYCKKLMSIVKNCQKYSMELKGWHHYSDYSGVNITMNKTTGLLHKLVRTIFNHQDIRLNLKNCGNLKEQFEVIREGNDALLERINIDVDEAKGLRRNADIQVAESNIRTIQSTSNNGGSPGMVLLAARNVQKPQLFFVPKIDNTDKPFIPMIQEKPNSMKPLSVMLCADDSERDYYSHPYEYELNHWSPSEKDLEMPKPTKSKPFTKTPFNLIEDEASLNELVEDLKKQRVFAVDLEHHSFRSYQGLTCLIQLSTRDKDYLIDPFPLRNHLSVLNEVFTDPKITKVFHGADSDVLWLQRDCGVYIVNMFDTHQAAIVLDYPHRSLAKLMQTFCGILMDKKYQRADWRIRPVPADFVEYARMDTHYLLYIYDCLKKELIEKGNDQHNLLRSVFDRSTELCLKRYEKPITGPDSHLDLYRRSRKHYNNRQLYALQEIFQWRDRIARQQDESADYVLPKHMLMQIAEVLPKEIQGIFACCNPIPPLIKTEQLTLHQIIRSARNMTDDEINENLTQFQLKESMSLNVHHATSGESCLVKHDLSSIDVDPKGLSSLLNPQESLLGDLFDPVKVTGIVRKKSVLFGSSQKNLRARRLKATACADLFLSPYQRYCLLKEREIAESELVAEGDAEEERTQNKPVAHSDDISGLIKIDSSSITEEEKMSRLQSQISSFLTAVSTDVCEKTSSDKSDSNEPDESDNMDPDESVDMDSSVSDLERFSRLQDHISSVLLDDDLPEQTSTSKKSKKASELESRKGEKREKPQPRKISKKFKSDSSLPKNVFDEAPEEEIQSFDYDNADFGVFRRGKPAKFKPKKFKGGFKQKSIRNPAEESQGNPKSFSWAQNSHK